LWVDYTGDGRFEGANSHGGGHVEAEGMMEFELLVDAFELVGVEVGLSSRVVWGEGGDVKDVVVENDECEFVFLGVV
jgi:hypothetical protein